MTQSDTSNSPELVAELQPFRDGQVRALYRVDGELFEVSTVPHTSGGVAGPLDGLLGVMGAIIGPGDPAAEYAVDRDPDAEETMAFRCREDGSRVNSLHVVAAQGEGSRQRVLDMLAGGQRWPWLDEAE